MAKETPAEYIGDLTVGQVAAAIRGDLKLLSEVVGIKLEEAEEGSPEGKELKRNLDLAYRHLNDARMLLSLVE